MRLCRIIIENFRGIQRGQLTLTPNCVIVGDNNSGKSTILEAIDLVLGPERLSRRPPIDEHDFYGSSYIDADGKLIRISVEVLVAGLTAEQQAYFRDHLEWWDSESGTVLDGPPASATDKPTVEPALRLMFRGEYDRDEDDFVGSTHFLSPERDDGSLDPFRRADKRRCGFLFLRALRTGSRALSLERGSLLDIILKLQEKRLRMWEEVLDELRTLPVAEQSEIGLSDILSKVEEAVRSFVPADWGDSPRMRVSDLTREGLRKSLTVFLGTGALASNGGPHAAPFHHQGTGTINALVLALLSMIAELRTGGVLRGVQATQPPGVKPKKYREDVRKRLCEALLAKRVLITEGRTEYDALPAAARRLHSVDSANYASLEALGIAVVNAETDSQVSPLAKYFRDLGKEVFAAFDWQPSAAERDAIAAAASQTFESPEVGFERLVGLHSDISALRRFGLAAVSDGDWPLHLGASTPTVNMADSDLRAAMEAFFKVGKGAGWAADFLAQCGPAEMPDYVTQLVAKLTILIRKHEIAPSPSSAEEQSGGMSESGT